MYGYIYKTTNILNNNIYIGQHKAKSFEPKKYIGSGKLIHLAIKKYGRKNFICELLEECFSEDDLNEKEIKWIKYYKELNNQTYKIYNKSEGGQKGNFKNCHHTTVTRKIISESSVNRTWINNGKINKLIKNDLLDNYLSSGWILGALKDCSYKNNKERCKKISNKKLGKKFYTNGIKNVLLSDIEFEKNYKNLNYRPGIVKKDNSIIYFDLYITNGEIIKRVISSKYDSYLNSGWSKYPCDLDEAKIKYKKYRDNFKKELSDKKRTIMLNYHENVSTENRKIRCDKIKEARLKQTNLNLQGQKGKTLIYNPEQNIHKSIPKEDIQKYIDLGWIKGMNPDIRKKAGEKQKGKVISEDTRKKLSQSHLNQQKNNKWINNGKINKRVDKNILDNYLSNGWVLGRIKC